jgi:hypothetical protein
MLTLFDLAGLLEGSQDMQHWLVLDIHKLDMPNSTVILTSGRFQSCCAGGMLLTFKQVCCGPCQQQQ